MREHYYLQSDLQSNPERTGGATARAPPPSAQRGGCSARYRPPSLAHEDLQKAAAGERDCDQNTMHDKNASTPYYTPTRN